MERSAEGSQLTRRAVLTSAAGATFGLAGCLERGGSSTQSSPTESASFLEGISFDGQDMVVQLSDEHSVDRLNLIGPDGSEFASTTVAAGETKVRLRILEISSGDYVHYQPGKSELHAVSGENVNSAEITLQPSIEIQNVEQYSGSKHRDYGNVEISMKNSGSAPTWVYDIYFQDAPNEEAEKEGEGVGSPTLYLLEPDQPEETILKPGESETFVDSHPPFFFQEKSACDGQQRATKAVVKTASGTTVQANLQANLNGEALRVDPGSLNKEYSCKNMSVSKDAKNDE